ncbi:MAG: dihydroneopterin aldolase [Pseudanabaenales cyanobacterium]|nr:dihydroneopterin aldolase [Pseudanabaenales cyanobacterium]
MAAKDLFHDAVKQARDMESLRLGMDSIQLTGIRAYGYTGVLPEEQVLGQWFEVNLILWLDLSQAGESDRLTDTYDYRGVINTTQQIIKTEKFALIEKLASAIAQAALQTDHRLSQVQVKLSKLAAPIPDFSGEISVEITRSQSAHLKSSSPTLKTPT